MAFDLIGLGVFILMCTLYINYYEFLDNKDLSNMVEKVEGAKEPALNDGGDVAAEVQEFGEAELEILNKYLQQACCTLLDVNHDLFNREIHLAAS